MTLNNLRHRNTDKFDLGYIQEFYDDLFIPRQETTTKVLELGVYNGESVMLWRDFFVNATIYGIDINNINHLNNESRIIALTADGYSENTISLIKKFEPNGFDIIIDDGPHTLLSMKFFLKHYIPLLKNGGILVLEDIIDHSWTPELLNLIDTTTVNATVINMGGKALTNDLREKWKHGLDVIIVQKDKLYGS